MNEVIKISENSHHLSSSLMVSSRNIYWFKCYRGSKSLLLTGSYLLKYLQVLPSDLKQKESLSEGVSYRIWRVAFRFNHNLKQRYEKQKPLAVSPANHKYWTWWLKMQKLATSLLLRAVAFRIQKSFEKAEAREGLKQFAFFNRHQVQYLWPGPRPDNRLCSKLWMLYKTTTLFG